MGRAPRGVQAARKPMVTRAAVDPEAFVKKFSDKFEASENQPVVIGYGVGFLVALYIVESLIHLPLLNILVGFPLEVLGLCSAGVLGYKYFAEDGKPEEDLDATLTKIAKELPGLKD